MFVQTISYTTTKPEEIERLSREFDERHGTDAPGFMGYRVLKDRDRENAYLVIAEFESYELAMENSSRPETDEFARKMAEVVDGEVTYGNYDVVASSS